MSKTSSRTNLGSLKLTPKMFWNQVVRDAENRLARLKCKAAGLEEAIQIFRRNALENSPIPGTESQKAGTDAKSIPA